MSQSHQKFEHIFGILHEHIITRDDSENGALKEVVPILTCVVYTLNWLTLTPKTHFAQFYLKITFYFLSWGKNKYVTLGMRLLWKYIRKSKLVYQ